MAESRWESPACPLCGGGNHVLAREAPEQDGPTGGPLFRLVRCSACGLVFLNPRPIEADIGRFYPADYEPHQPTAGTSNPNKMERRLVGRPTAEHRRLLDVGCGNGAFLRRMNALGWEVCGVDPAASAVESIRQRLGLPALVGSVPHPELPPSSFDAVTLWQVLEHLHRPLETLGAIRDLLTPQGRLILSVPNVESRAAEFFGNAWIGVDLPKHMLHFSRATLRQMVEKAGFRVLSVQLLRESEWVRRSAELAVRRGCKSALMRLLTIRKASSFLSRWWHCRGRGDNILLVAEKPATS